MEDHTRNAPTRHSGTATSVVASRSRSNRPRSASDGRTTVAWRRIAAQLARRAMSRVEATPDLRRDRAPQRDTVPLVRVNRTQPMTAAAAARVAVSSGATTASHHPATTTAAPAAAARVYCPRWAATTVSTPAAASAASSSTVNSVMPDHLQAPGGLRPCRSCRWCGGCRGR